MADPRSGRGTPRMAETPSGMLNSIGLQGPGISAFVDKDLAWLKQAGARTLVSIAGNTSGEFADVAATLRASAAFDAVVGVEVNISCPNVANRGLVFACDPMASAKVVALVREQLPRDVPIFAKLTPDVTDIVSVAQACVKAGADGLTMINTLLGMVIDTDRLRPQVAGVTGGLSGPAIRPVAVRADLADPGRHARGPAARPCRSSASGECAPVATRSSWSPPGPAPSRSGPRRSTTRAPRCGWVASWQDCCRTRDSSGSPTLSAWPTGGWHDTMKPADRT